MLDGADCNRQFVQMHFRNKDPAESKFVTPNIYTGEAMVFIMDPKVIFLVNVIYEMDLLIKCDHDTHNNFSVLNLIALKLVF